MLLEFLLANTKVSCLVTSLYMVNLRFGSIWIYKKPQMMEFGLLLFLPLVWISVSIAMYGLFHAGRGLVRIKGVEKIPKALLWLSVWLLAIGGIGLASFSEYTGVLLALPGAASALPAGIICARNQNKKGFTVIPIAIVIFLMPFALGV